MLTWFLNIHTARSSLSKPPGFHGSLASMELMGYSCVADCLAFKYVIFFPSADYRRCCFCRNYPCFYCFFFSPRLQVISCSFSTFCVIILVLAHLICLLSVHALYSIPPPPLLVLYLYPFLPPLLPRSSILSSLPLSLSLIFFSFPLRLYFRLRILLHVLTTILIVLKRRKSAPSGV